MMGLWVYVSRNRRSGRDLHRGSWTALVSATKTSPPATRGLDRQLVRATCKWTVRNSSGSGHADTGSCWGPCGSPGRERRAPHRVWDRDRRPVHRAPYSASSPLWSTVTRSGPTGRVEPLCLRHLCSQELTHNHGEDPANRQRTTAPSGRPPRLAFTRLQTATWRS